MMSVNEFFYGNQPTTTQILRTSSSVKHQHAQYGNRSPLWHDSAIARDDHDAVQQVYSRNYLNPSNLHSYTSRSQQDSQLLVNNRYNSSTYISTSARDYNDSSATLGLNHRRPNPSADFSSPRSYSRHSSQGGHSKPVSMWVELRVPICCEGCVERLDSHLLELRGVESVACDQRKQRVVVRGTAAASEVLRVCKKLFKRSEFWRYQYDWL